MQVVAFYTGGWQFVLFTLNNYFSIYLVNSFPVWNNYERHTTTLLIYLAKIELLSAYLNVQHNV